MDDIILKAIIAKLTPETINMVANKAHPKPSVMY